MHIFLVNDDGIQAKGIQALVRAATAKGHRVTMCAPATQQSAASQRITLAEPIYVAPYPADSPLVTAYAITGTPTDCVRLGLQDLVKDPVDVLISGINNGYNSGMAVHYSGTVAAAQEGALNGLHAIACSIHYQASQELIDRFAAFVVDTAESFVSLSLPRGVILNINAPDDSQGPWKEPVLAPLCTSNFTDGYLRRKSPRAGVYYWLDGSSSTEPPTPGADQDLLSKGHITMTFMGNPSDHGAAFCDFVTACQNPLKPR
ncbi:MAG: 5'/3'-nucleotidase SurE [Clostridiales bacterium]|nr:5'/3'-nucleotidase SurE [Clostridiales bacterium]